MSIRNIKQVKSEGALKQMKHPYLNNNETLTRYEKIPLKIYSTADEASLSVANEIAAMIRIKELMGEPCILGLVTGNTPIKVYSELVRMHKEDGLSFRNVVTFNLYEFYPLKPNELQISRHFMNEHLFDHIDILPENIHLPDGSISSNEVREYCKKYERLIESFGNFDLLFLGLGANGQVAFNESGSSRISKTRVVTLDNFNIVNADNTFKGLDTIPRKVITVGMKSILSAKKILMLSLGDQRSHVVKDIVEGEVSSQMSATFLQEHQGPASSLELTRMKTPWLIDVCEWDDNLIRKAVVWLCQKLNKSILKLTDKDYNDNRMNDLLGHYESAYKINLKVFNELQRTITGWPGGKDNADDTNRPERSKPFPKRVLIFSPHPDDDVISMGGTFLRLVEQQHEVHVAYQTSGNIAVADDEALRFADFLKDCNRMIFNDNDASVQFFEKVKSSITNKKQNQNDIEEVRTIKGLIRRGEAKAACRSFGVDESRIRFLDLPFYETGTIKKNPLGEADIQIIYNLLQEIKPHQIYAAGDLADPHGTHKVCLEGIFEALDRLKSEAWLNDCYVWLYRGAWMEWEVNEIEMAVPLSPLEVMRKRWAIFKHQSQKDGVVFQGSDSREFWQRAEERNRETANLYDALGMAEYEAMEAFVRYLP